MKRYPPPNVPTPPSPVMRSENWFAFRFSRGNSTRRAAAVEGVRLASKTEWTDAVPFPFLDSGDFLDMNLMALAERGSFEGRRYPVAEKYEDLMTIRMASVNKVFLALPSFSGPDVPHGGFLPIDEWWRTVVIDFFRIPTAKRIGRIKAWTCLGGLGNPLLMVWHGDQFLTMPLTEDDRQLILCDFRGR